MESTTVCLMLCSVSYQPANAYFGIFSLSGTAIKREILDLAYNNRKKIAPLSRVHRFCTPAVLRHTQCTRDHAHVETTLTSDWLPPPPQKKDTRRIADLPVSALLVNCILSSSPLSHRIGFFLLILTAFERSRIFSWSFSLNVSPHPVTVSHSMLVNCLMLNCTGICMYVFTDLEGTKCPKKTILGRI